MNATEVRITTIEMLDAKKQAITPTETCTKPRRNQRGKVPTLEDT